MPALGMLLDFLCFVYGSWWKHCQPRWEFPANCVCEHRLACNFRCIIIPFDFSMHLYDDFAPLPPSSTVIFFPVSRDPPLFLPISPFKLYPILSLSTTPTPSFYGLLYFHGFCSYLRLYFHISILRARNLRWETTCNFGFQGLGYLTW